VSVKTFVTSHLASQQVSRVIYGSIIGLALVVALQAHPPKPGVVVASILGTAVAVALAELYSELVGFETANRRPAARDDRLHIEKDVGAVAFGISFPAIFFVLAAASVVDDDTAFTLAKWTGVGLIGIYGFAGGRLGGRSMLASIVQALAVALIGAALIGLKALVH
jgi:hypothetical protein